MVREAEIEPSALRLVMDMTKQNGFGKQSMLECLEKFGEYVKHSKMVDEIYSTFDKDGNGGLGRAEFRKALEAHEKKHKREVDGVVVQLTVDDADLDFILEKADADKDGEISKNEMLPALAAWEEMAAVKLESQEGCCVIL